MDVRINRILSMFRRLQAGDIINKAEEAARYNLNEKTIQRDIDQIRGHLANSYDNDMRVVYSKKYNGYYMTRDQGDELTNSEVFAVCKILLESRSMTRNEMMPILEKLVKKCVPTTEYKKVERLISNEKFHYLEPHHGKDFVKDMWDIATSVFETRFLKITYQKNSTNELVTRTLKPVGIMFSEYYFYLTAFISHGDNLAEIPKIDFPTIYRIDRIETFQVLNEHFHIPYANRFEEGEFRKRIQFMIGGKIRTIKFRCCEGSLEAILDRLPTAEIVESNDGVYLIRAEVYGNGVDMWIRSQGDNIEMINNEEGDSKP